MAHTKAGGSTKNNRESAPKYLGIKLHDGKKAIPGSIIVRQRGTHYEPGVGVKAGTDDTIYAVKEGTVKFVRKPVRRFDGSRLTKIVVKIV